MPRFLASPISPDQAIAAIRDRVARREDRFLRKIEQAVFRHPESPYLRLMEAAGCDLDDVRRLVREDGVEAALERLARAGVYITWDEFKGRVPVRRGGREWRFHERDFDNPAAREYFRSSTSGSSGTPVRTRMDLDELEEAAPNWAAWFQAHLWMGRPLVFWTPGHTGLASRYLRCAKFGMPYRKWFVTMEVKALEDRVRSSAVHYLARRAAGLSRPEPAPVNDPGRVAGYLLELLAAGERPLVNTAPSAAARLSLAMLDRGQRLDGVTFLLGAEPVTPARKATIEHSGAAAVPTYGTSEGGWIGAQFPGAAMADEVHIFRDAYAVIAREESEPDAGAPEDGPSPVLFTNLRAASPKVLLNAELGDSAVIARGATGAAAELGYDVRMHTIRSFRKITAWGVTLALGDLYSVIEETLPREFGGGVADYQLLEDQDERGISALCLLISPEVGPIPEARVRETFFRELARKRPYYRFMTALLDQAGALRIERRRPAATSRDKLLPVVPHRAA
ncbi:MAG: hypothetical protein KIT09_19385 [Bryobacteraceae bacterium]|nr:hypothetical protein [Bryobacteraceae bacterium]